MDRSIRILLSAGAGLLLLAGAVRADTIKRSPSPLENVTVKKETYKKVVYQLGDTAIQNEMDRKKDRILGVEYDEWPEGWESGKEALAASDFQRAFNDFMDVAKASSEDFPQAKQYGQFWMAETCRRWGESGNGDALKQAIGRYKELMANEPETVFLARVYIGLGNCLLLTGSTDEAMGYFDKVFADEYFSEGEKVLAKLGKAQVLERGAKFPAAAAEYTAILGEAQKSAPEMVYMVRVRIANCNLNIQGKVDEAQEEFNRILASSDLPVDSRANIRASALNGRGECWWKKREYEKAMWDFLRVVILHEAVTSESPKAYNFAVQCMRNWARALEKESKKEEAGMWKRRAKELEDELRNKFPGSPYARAG